MLRFAGDQWRVLSPDSPMWCSPGLEWRVYGCAPHGAAPSGATRESVVASRNISEGRG
jgi:hypothetical protein